MRYFISSLFFVFLLSCEESPTRSGGGFPLPNNLSNSQTGTITKTTSSQEIEMDSSAYYDKVLGLLVGSAIGDAMGAPVEMWDKNDIKNRYGFITKLIPNARVASAEGTWKTNMGAGTSTDDTRWKWLMGEFFLSLDATIADTTQAFAKYLVDEYEELKSKIVKENGLNPNDIEANVRYLQWLQEWVKVSEAYLSNDVNQYINSANKFYGGEMACGGMLYAPMIGLLHPNEPSKAYELGWSMSIFDIGYAKDITAMTAALTAMAFDEKVSTDSLLSIHYNIDNQSLADSRLIGRIVNSIYESALLDRNNILRKQKENNYAWDKNKLREMPAYFENDPSKYFLMLDLFASMDNKLQDIPFHANEIYMITLSSLLFAQGDFMDAMVFVTNYGRDNDTAGAVVGAILGAQLGFERLPKKIKEQVLEANKKELNIDLELMAKQLVKNKTFVKKLNS